MGDVTGRISTLPGAIHEMPTGSTCDSHPSRLAVARVQGETDSFGCELIDMCQECLDADRAYARSAEASSGRCDWCKGHATDLRDRRDYEEGMCGPVYRVCGACRARHDAYVAEDLDQDDYWDGEP